MMALRSGDVDIDVKQRLVTNSDVDGTMNDVEIPTLRSGNVDELTTGSSSD
jgi:hypothetical protein